MITFDQTFFKLDTDHTTYLIQILPHGQLAHLYYGAYLRTSENYAPLEEKIATGCGNTVAYRRQDNAYCLEQYCLEFSGAGKGDYRESPIELQFEDGSFTTDFVYRAHSIYAGRKQIPGLPCAVGEEAQCQTLEITMEDAAKGTEVTLFYHVFPETDVITRHMRIHASGQPVKIRRAMSAMLDLPTSDYHLVTFDGAWTKEMSRHDKKLMQGTYQSDSKCGTSSNRHNPFVILRQNDCTESTGACYGINLIYSGNHCQMAEVSHYGHLRFVTGINPYAFCWTLQKGECFDTPEAVLSFAKDGLNGLSRNLHHFIRSHIVRGHWKKKPRPVLLNSWEANYFDLQEENLYAQAKLASELGVELFVMDDGWFGERGDETSSLGDWTVNNHKLPHGLDGFAARLQELGLDFGLWVEPEMISANSSLYRDHPDWAITIPGREPSEGRNQMVLDITRAEVRQELLEQLTRVFSSCRLSYVKWDMNRHLSDLYSAVPSHNEAFFHRYTLGLYNLLEQLTSAFPEVLFEGCSAGGNRFDLGILCYMPQIWTSDNTDAICRLDIQTGCSYGYPPSTMGAHVSSCPNHQLGRTTPIHTRFAVAAFGLLGYELNPLTLSQEERAAVSEQIAFYKQVRNLVQMGDFYRLKTLREDAPHAAWVVVSPDQKEALVGVFQTLAMPNPAPDLLRLAGLDPALRYEITERFYPAAQIPQQHVAYGDLLCEGGIKLFQQMCGAGLHEKTRYMGDFGARLYSVKAV